jgi:hypothetical protein
MSKHVRASNLKNGKLIAHHTCEEGIYARASPEVIYDK